MLLSVLVISIASSQEWNVNRQDDFDRNDGIQGDLKAVHFIDHNNGWAVGLQGLALHTTDGGKSWENIDLKQERIEDLWNVYFSDDKTGFMTGTGGMILMTYDGGVSWQAPQVENRRRITKTWMVTDQIGFMVGENSTVLKSVDGGKSWAGEAERVRVGEKRTNLEDVFFVSPNEGWIVGSFGTVMHTIDSGQNWEKVVLDEIDHNLTKGCNYLPLGSGNLDED